MDDSIEVFCPACDSEQVAADSMIGVLGYIVHLKCRYCGMLFDMPVEDFEDE